MPDEVALAYEQLPDGIDFNDHVRPILSDRCYPCHGPDSGTRKAELRLDIESEAFKRLKESGGRAFVRGNHGKSVAWRRITSSDPEFQMPPPESNLSLTSREIAIIGKWLDEGAEWKDHWAFIPPVDPILSDLGETQVSIRNPIDHFIAKKLQSTELTMSPEADKERMIRRVHLDLTGLPPSVEDLDRFLSAQSEDAYGQEVDRLLDTSAYAERLAMEWLDVARFADSQGLHSDVARFNWPWRDWVIKAFDENMPYDEFITWQLAGDLLPNASRDQRLATAFLRNHVTTSEGGAVNDEYRQKYVNDRTATTATAFLGLTVECASCHDHKFDPVSQKEFYQMTGFFNNIKELGMQAEMVPKDGFSSGPTMLYLTEEQEEELARLDFEIEEARTKLEEISTTFESNPSLGDFAKVRGPETVGHFPFESIRDANRTWSSPHRIVANRPVDKIVDENLIAVASGEPLVIEGKVGKALRFVDERDLVFLRDFGDLEVHEPFSAGAWIKMEKDSVNQTVIGNSGPLGDAWRGWGLYIDPENRLNLKLTSVEPHNYTQLTSNKSIESTEWQHVFFTYDGTGKAEGIRLYLNGERLEGFSPYDRLFKSIQPSWNVSKDWGSKPIIVGRSGRFYTGENGVFEGGIDEVRVYRERLTDHEIASIVARDDPALADSRVNAERSKNHTLERLNKGYGSALAVIQSLVKQRIDLLNDLPELMIMEESAEKRKTFVLDRGVYDQPLEEVLPGTPEAILAFNEDLPKNRLGLSQWLTDPKNPLTARVTVNRYWQMIFGRGLVDTPHDFGLQGSLPSHPRLLDWLALEFVDSGWDVKGLMKTMVMSATYRQSSVASDLHLEIDPQNRLLARGPSNRMPAEMIRDLALASSGLLSRQVGGKSVKPYQPKGVWASSTGKWNSWKTQKGDSLYRRSMYTYIRRTTPHPAMLAFDATDRSVTTIKREKTTTPMQALVLLNDPQFVEAARVLAERMQKEGGDTIESQLMYAFRLVTGRRLSDKESEILVRQFNREMLTYSEKKRDARGLLAVGFATRDPNLDVRTTAALAGVASSIMNHDEAINKR